MSVQLDYVTGVPATPNNPSNDQPPMLLNTNVIPVFLSVDHIGYGVINSGCHKVIHQITYPSSSPTGNTWNPTAKTGLPSANSICNQVVSLNYVPAYSGATSDTQLFVLSKTGAVSQLTGHRANPTTGTWAASPVLANGWQWVGGILIQWGMQTVTGGFPNNGTVTFTTNSQGIPFPNKLFNVQVTYIVDSSNLPSGTSSPAIFIDPFQYTTTGFVWRVIGSAAQYKGFQWLAIGN